MGDNKIRYDTIDYIKGLACIAVVFIHFNFPGFLGGSVKAVCRFAVPFFFWVSGFFLMRNFMSLDSRSINRKIKHILIIVTKASLLYFLFDIVWQYLRNPLIDYSIYYGKIFHYAKFIKYIVTNDPFVYAHLWFLLALIYCYLFLKITYNPFANLYRGKSLIVFSGILLLGFIFLAEFRTILPFKNLYHIPGTKYFIVYFNLFLFRALPFFLIGLCCRIYQDKIKSLKVKSRTLVTLAILGGVASILEYKLFGICQFYIGSYVTLLSFSILAVKNMRIGFGERYIKFLGQELSLYVYIYHIAVGKSVQLFATHYHLFNYRWFKYTQSIIILIITLLICYLYFRLKNDKNLRTRF